MASGDVNRVTSLSPTVYAINRTFAPLQFEIFGPALQLFRIESERLELPAPFSREISGTFDANAAGKATFYGGFDEIGGEQGK